MILKNFRKNFSLILVPLCIMIVALIAKTYVTSTTTNEVVYLKERVRPGYETAPAEYKVSPSPSKAWELTSKSTSANVWRIVGIVAFWLLIALLVLVILDEAPVTLTSTHLTIITAILLIIWAAGNYAAYGAVLENNWVTISPETYLVLKDVPEGFDKLFDDKDVIK